MCRGVRKVLSIVLGSAADLSSLVKALFAAAFPLFAYAASAYAEPIQPITFAWDAPDTCDACDHYTVKVSFVGSGDYDNATRLVVPYPTLTGTVLLDRARDHWAIVTVTDGAQNESGPSNEVMVAQLETPTPTPEPSPTPSATPLPTATPTALPTATATPRPTPTRTPTPVPTLTESQRAAKYIADSDRFQQCIYVTYPSIYSRCWR